MCHHMASAIAYLGSLRLICATVWPVPSLTWDGLGGSVLPRGHCHHLLGIAEVDLCYHVASAIAYLGSLRWIFVTTWPVPSLMWDRWFGSVPPRGQYHRLLGIAEVDLCYHMASAMAYVGSLVWICATMWPVPSLTWDC